MSEQLTLTFETLGDPPNKLSSAWLINEGNAQLVAQLVQKDNYTASLDLGQVPSGRYWLSAKITNHPVLRFTIQVSGEGQRKVSFVGGTPRCASLSDHCVIQGSKKCSRAYIIKFSLPRKHSAIVLVAGFDHHYKKGQPVNYAIYARRWRDDLYRGMTDAGGVPNQKIDRGIFDHTVVSIFDFATGDLCEQIRSTKGWHTMYECMCGKERPHTANPRLDKELRELTDSISITDVYAHISKIGRDAPRSLQQLHFFSHAYYMGPVLVNTDVHSSTNERDPKDKDPRPNDFKEPNLKRWSHLKEAFAPNASMKSWGCNVERRLRRQILAVMHAKDDREQVKHGGDVITRAEVMGDIRDAASKSYIMACVDALGLDAWAAAPGTAANYDTGQFHVPDSVFGSIVGWYEKNFGGRRDLTSHFPYVKLKEDRRP
ncbi:MAG: hypothetical protein R6X02_23860 [Enhygromyxa sp.]